MYAAVEDELSGWYVDLSFKWFSILLMYVCMSMMIVALDLSACRAIR